MESPPRYSKSTTMNLEVHTEASQTATSWRCDQAWKAKQFNVLYNPNSQKEFHITEPATKPDWHTRICYPTLTEQLKAPLGKKKVTGTKTHLTALVLKPNNIRGCETLACLKEVKENRLKAKDKCLIHLSLRRTFFERREITLRRRKRSPEFNKK